MSEVRESTRILSFDRYTLFSQNANSNGRKARLVFSFANGFARITVFTNDASDIDQKQMIAVTLEPGVVMGLFDLISRVSSSKKEARYAIECFAPVKDADGRMMDKALQGQIVIGRDEDSFVWMSVFAEGRPKIKFVFASGNFSVFKNTDGSPMSEADVSSILAAATVRSLAAVYNIQFEKSAVEFSNRPKVDRNQTQSKPSYEKKQEASSGSEFNDIPY